WHQVCGDAGKNSIEEFGFGKGYGLAIKYWEEVVKLLELCGEREDLGLGPNMMTVLIAHSKITRFEDPSTDPYDRYEPNLHKTATAFLQEWCDEVLFTKFRVSTKTVGDGFNKSTRGVSAGERLLYTTEEPSHLAKNRLSLP